MKKVFYYLSLLIVLLINASNVQGQNSIEYLNQLPKGLKLDNSLIRSFQMTTDYHDFNFKGTFIGKKRLTGKVTFGIKGDLMQWKDVYYSESKNIEAPFPQGKKQEFMQGFTYKQDENIVTEAFFERLPEANILIKNLFWDMMGFDVFAYQYWDSLELNKEYLTKEINFDVDLAGEGTFENKDIRLTWLGITEINQEICAVIKYSALNNPLKIQLENMSISGRSHYWGEIYVSLSDKQIEYASLSEDVLTDVKLKGHPNNILGYTVRTILLEKIE